VKIFYKEDVMKIVEFIRKGGLCGVLVDGNTLYSKLEKIKRFSRLCNVPLIPFAAFRENGKGILELGCNLDDMIKRRPLDYLWFYKSRGP
jgi:hypothetical protein